MGKLKIVGIGGTCLRKAGVEAVAKAYLETPLPVEVVFLPANRPEDLGQMQMRTREDPKGCLRPLEAGGYRVEVYHCKILRSMFNPTGRRLPRETRIWIYLSTLVHEFRHIWQFENWSDEAWEHECGIIGDEWANYRYSKAELDAVGFECQEVQTARRIYDAATAKKPTRKGRKKAVAGPKLEQ
jgi:hypothetical protein